jgi:hypothetical protein
MGKANQAAIGIYSRLNTGVLAAWTLAAGIQPVAIRVERCGSGFFELWYE